MAFDRPFGSIRAEVEGRGRDSLEDSLAVTAIPLATGSGRWVAADSWSTMVNVWRDLPVTDAVDLYVGGGIGAGGSTYAVNGHYQLTGITPNFFFGGPDTAQSFAWQAGCGTKWALSERVELDLGYRFFALGATTTPVTRMEGSFWRGTEDIRHAFSASELLFSVRIYEPFRALRR
jgi:opacity protein-like surface antigen